MRSWGLVVIAVLGACDIASAPIAAGICEVKEGKCDGDQVVGCHVVCHGVDYCEPVTGNVDCRALGKTCRTGRDFGAACVDEPVEACEPLGDLGACLPDDEVSRCQGNGFRVSGRCEIGKTCFVARPGQTQAVCVDDPVVVCDYVTFTPHCVDELALQQCDAGGVITNTCQTRCVVDVCN